MSSWASLHLIISCYCWLLLKHTNDFACCRSISVMQRKRTNHLWRTKFPNNNKRTPAVMVAQALTLQKIWCPCILTKAWIVGELSSVRWITWRQRWSKASKRRWLRIYGRSAALSSKWSRARFHSLARKTTQSSPRLTIGRLSGQRNLNWIQSSGT